MKKQKLFSAIVLIGIGSNLLFPNNANADTYCSSYGTFGSCIDSPYYKTPAPTPVKPLPVWVCSVIYTAQAITTVIPGGSIPTLISRIILIPTIACAWN